jgi:hypothetical protein
VFVDLPAMVSPLGRDFIAICNNNIAIRNKTQEGQRKNIFLAEVGELSMQ